jgi:hypothetical protein
LEKEFFTSPDTRQPASSVGLRCFQINNKKRTSFLTRLKYETASSKTGKIIEKAQAS